MSSSQSISEYIRRFEKAKQIADEFISPLDDRTFRRQPSSKAWCIGECYSHLVEAGTKYYQSIKTGLEKTEASNVKPEDPMHLRFHMRWFVNYLEPPISFKTPAPGAFKPSKYAKLDKDTILNNFLKLQDNYIYQLNMAERGNIDLSRVKVPNPVTSLIKMTVAECIAVTEAHQRRHFEQAENTLQQIKSIN